MKAQKLAAQLAEWEKQGLITAAQSGGIIDYENSRRTVPWVIYSFIMLGVTVVAVGVISLVAANWSTIPAWVKLTADFAILIALAACLCRFGDGAKPAVFDAIAAFFILFCLASIGLIAQIYHTGGQLYQALLLWCAITLPVTLFAFKRFIPYLWAAAFLIAVISYCVHENRLGGPDAVYRLAIFWSLPLAVLLVGVICRSIRPFGLLAGPFFFWAVITCLGATVYFDVAHSSGMILQNSTHPARLFYYDGYGAGQVEASTNVLYLTVDFLTAAAIAAIFFMKSLVKKARIVLCLLAALFCIMMNIYGIIDYPAYSKNYGFSAADYPLLLKLMGPAVCISMLLLFSFLFATLHHQRLFNLCVNLIGLRFLIIYFQVFGSLATTGIGLIVSGLIIIGAVVGWYKSRKQLQAWLGGLLG
jgi:uncharacterized membrane protein